MQETSINIAEILKNCPHGTKLYSTIHGEVELKSAGYTTIKVEATNCNREKREAEFNAYGRFLRPYPDAECTLFPARDQRDWTKFRQPLPPLEPNTICLCRTRLCPREWQLRIYKPTYTANPQDAIPSTFLQSFTHIIPQDRFSYDDPDSNLKSPYNYVGQLGEEK